MKARELFSRRVSVAEQAFAELVLWELPEPLSGSMHRYKYRLAFVVAGKCVLRYDNETGKGGHKHVRGKEVKYRLSFNVKLAQRFVCLLSRKRARIEVRETGMASLYH